MDPADLDALLVLSFGGPEAPSDVVPFLRRVTAGRGVPDQRLTQVAGQYEQFGGVSPLPALNRDLVSRLRANAPEHWRGDRVYLANRNSDPLPASALRDMADAGVRRAAVFVTSAFSSYSGCRQYRENLADGLAEAGVEMDLRVLPRFFGHPLLRDVWADRVAAAELGVDTSLLFVTHSLPVSQAYGAVPGVSGYLPQHEELARAIVTTVAARGASPADWSLVFQSRSGPPAQPWLEPDIGDAVAAAAAAGRRRVVVAPIGFLADNLEIRWDLEAVAQQVARDHGIGFTLVEPPQTDERIERMIWDLLVSGSGSPCRSQCCPNPHGTHPAVGEAS